MSFLDFLRNPFERLANAEPKAKTAGEQDHSDPWVYAGVDAEAPTNSEGVDK